MKSGKEKKKKIQKFTIDITKIDGDGAFPCPKCGTTISPDDEEEENYRVVDAKVKNDDLEKLKIMCKGCGIEITMTGFLCSA